MGQNKEMLNKIIRMKKEIDDLLEKRRNLDKDLNGGYYLESLNDKIISMQIKLRHFGKIYFGNNLNLTDIETLIDREIENKVKQDQQTIITKSCYQAIVDLERKIDDPEGYMENALWKTRDFYDKKCLAVDSDSQDSMHKSKEDTSYCLKGN